MDDEKEDLIDKIADFFLNIPCIGPFLLILIGPLLVGIPILIFVYGLEFILKIFRAIGISEEDYLYALIILVLLIVIVYLINKNKSNQIRNSVYPENWDEIASEIRERDGHCCNNCGTHYSTLHVHHIVPLSRGGSNEPGNLITLCGDCHKKIHPHMS